MLRGRRLRRSSTVGWTHALLSTARIATLFNVPLAIAAGADGLLIEVHHDPDHALSDGAQSMFPQQFRELMDQLSKIAPVVGRSI